MSNRVISTKDWGKVKRIISFQEFADLPELKPVRNNKQGLPRVGTGLRLKENRVNLTIIAPYTKTHSDVRLYAGIYRIDTVEALVVDPPIFEVAMSVIAQYGDALLQLNFIASQFVTPSESGELVASSLTNNAVLWLGVAENDIEPDDELVVSSTKGRS